MRTAFILMMTFLQAAAQTPAPAARIRGSVVDAVTGRPLTEAELYIPAITVPAGIGPPRIIRPAIFARTDANGRFTLNVPEPGPHEISATIRGYEQWTITLSAEEEQRGVDVTFRMVPWPKLGVIAGRAVDNRGQPIVGVQVDLLQYHYFSRLSLGGFSDRAELHALPGLLGPPYLSGGQTNDRGEYRFIDVPPGKYFLRVPSPGQQENLVTLPHFSPLGAAFYPGVAGLSKAKEIEVGEGQEVRVNDIVLEPSPLQPIRFPSSAPRISSLGGPFLEGGPATTAQLDGVPVIRPDEPGKYTICFGGCIEVTYTGAAMELDRIPATPRRASLTGRVLLEQTDGAPPVPLAGVVVGGVGTLLGTNIGGESESDGSFRASLLVPDGSFTLSYLAPPDGYYISSIHQGQRDALREGVLVAGEDTNLDVRVAKSSSVLRGRILGTDGKPVDRGFVVLIPQGALAPRADKLNTHRLATTNLNGTFEIRNVIPGMYRAFALAKVQAGSHLDAQAFKPYEEQSTPVDIGKDAAISIDLRLISPRD